MARVFARALAGLLLFAHPAPGFAQTAEPARRTIQVTGDAEVRVVPNEALVTMSVRVRDADLVKGRNKIDTAVRNVLALLRKLGVNSERVQTEYVEVSPEFGECDRSIRPAPICDPTRIEYYDLKKGIALRLSDLSKFEAVISESLQNGVTNIESVQFVTTDLRKYRDQARDMAVRAAQEKASAVAAALGQKIGKPVSITLDGNMAYLGSYGRAGGYANLAQNAVTNGGGGETFAGGSDSAVSLGKIKVSAQVAVIFELE